jgi:Ser/Thr protein kinase RdoA (MazF antagonist)
MLTALAVAQHRMGSALERLQVLTSWNCFGGSPQLVSPSGPRVVKVDAPAGSFYLKECASIEAVEREANLLGFLAGVGLAVPLHVPSVRGLPYAVDDGKVFWLSRKLKGRHFAQFQGSPGLEQAECLAVGLGELHHALAEAPDSLEFPAFRHSAEELIEKLSVRVTPFDVGRLQRLRGATASITSLPQQLIHRDAHRCNMLVEGGVVAAYLDFDLVHRGPRLFDVCYYASSVLSESFRADGYPAYWLGVVERIFRGYGRAVELSADERSKAWDMLLTIELIFMSSCLEGENIDAALLNQDILFWFEEHRREIEAELAA